MWGFAVEFAAGAIACRLSVTTLPRLPVASVRAQKALNVGIDLELLRDGKEPSKKKE